MNGTEIFNESRRNFLKAGAGLTLAFYLPDAVAENGSGNTEAARGSDFEPNAFVRIGNDNTVTVVAKHLEMGQGTYTGLATLVAEELDASWSQVRVEGAPADAKRYNNLLWGPMQGTGGSSAIANSFEQMRRAGATARAMLVAAAAQLWKVAPDSMTVRDGTVRHEQSGRSATFGQLAARAAALPVPADVKLKDAADFVFIGKHVPRKDSHDKTTGLAVFTQDVRLPGLLTAVVAHSPRFGGKVKSFDASKAKAYKGVVAVVEIPTGVAVLATDFWSAKQGRDALLVEWDDSEAFKLSSAEIVSQYRVLAKLPGMVAREEGDLNDAFAAAEKKQQSAFELPYLAHAAMEPLNCIARLSKNGCEIWNGEQFQTVDQISLSSVLGLKPEQVKLHMLYAGGSFGRRANPHSDYLVEAANIVKAIKGSAPVKLVWTREDDTRAGYYRPMYYHEMKAGLDANGKLVAWGHRIVGQSIMAGTPLEAAMVKNGIDGTSVEGAANLPYEIPNLLVDLHSPNIGVPVQWWRSVGSSHNAFVTETFVDDMAQLAGTDPVAFRISHLENHPRHIGVLQLAAEKAGWDSPLDPGREGERRGRGVAVHESFNSFVAQVAEVTVKQDGSFRVDRVVCAVDCGFAVNPDIIRAQMEGGIGYGLAAALHGEITLTDGKVDQSNFQDYPMLRIAEMPRVEVHIVPSNEKPTGVGEPGVPPIAPAVVNALFMATGKRIRQLPIGKQLEKA
ncbi:MAG TPA: xanthine dehydrogenase family protein molybdopterin-binding subunit [Burkholderiales bacterium]|nr:xanthine dehydrogenase family protein molybdopterin-binding subunit [Burkholderiales bacterium]